MTWLLPPRVGMLSLLFFLFLSNPAATAQTSASSTAAVALTQELARRGVTSIAARDPGRAGVYVAAMHIPGVQLLVVSGRSTAPDYLDHLLASERYGEVYASLNGESVTEGRLFVQDMQADGLRASRQNGESFDIVYDQVAKTYLFNGEWQKQHLTEPQYSSLFASMDRRYARMLSLLLSQLRSTS